MEADNVKLLESGRILSRVRELVMNLDIDGRSVLDLCEEIEAKIRRYGARPAFPCNIGINEVAAHYTSPWKDATLIPKDSIVKIDFGVEVDGFITDSAVTISLNPAFDSLKVAAEAALNEALSAVAPGRKLDDVGRIVERCVQRYGFQPIRNLTGHKIERYTIHSGKSVPNVGGAGGGRFEEGEVYALEPFVTLKEASGVVKDMDVCHIYRSVTRKGARSKDANALAQYIQDNYRTLPFALRWLHSALEDYITLKAAFQELLQAKCVAGYPVLVEASGRVVSQAEHTVLVTADGIKILTG